MICKEEQKPITINATFIGENSLGYVKGKKYKLKLTTQRSKPIIERADGSGGLCPYGSIGAFFRNWNLIRTK